MKRIEFTNEELEVLRELLQNQEHVMDVEILRTDTHDFKEMLKHRREVLEKILGKLPATPQLA
jgi:hypothetical protein